MPESARFHVVKGEMDKAEKVIRRIAWYNCRDPPKVSTCPKCVSIHPVCFQQPDTLECCTAKNVHVKLLTTRAIIKYMFLTLQVGDFST